jgi:hypothetical protein
MVAMGLRMVGAIDLSFILAVMAIGCGLSLATYRAFARRWEWPMGAWHQQRPELPVLVGLATVLLACAYALARGWGGHVLSAWLIALLGLAWAAFWTGFLRVGAQSALLLGPAAAALLLVRWLG